MSMHLTQPVHRAARHTPNRLATVFGERQHTYHQFSDRVARLAGAFQQLGVSPGDRIGILAHNSDRYVEAYMATFWAGGVTSAINTRWSHAEILHQLHDSRPRLLLVDDAFLDQQQALVHNAPSLQHVIYMGDNTAPENVHRYEALIESHAPVEDALRRDDDLAMIVYTGGTTGRSKGAMLSHANMLHASVGMLAMGCGAGDSLLLAVPMFHMAGIQMMFANFIGSGTQFVIPRFTPEATLHALQAHRPTSLMLVPTMLQMLLADKHINSYDLSGLQRVFYGAAPITEALLLQALEKLPGVEFIQGYGMSESGITLMLPGRYHTAEGRALGKLRSAGFAAPLAEIRIVDPLGYDLPHGTAGEITVRGPMVMQGYWEQPELTAQTLREGWLHSGDVGYMDDDGCVFIVDRTKDMIISGGENVYSAEVENALASHPDVQMCAVIGLPHARWGEVVHAVVVLHSDREVTAEALIQHCQERIAGYKCPKHISFRSNLPLSAAGKLLKYKLREELKSL